MTTIRPIYELQEMDSTIDRQQSELATVEARLVDNKLMEELKRRLSTNEERLMQTKSRQAMQDLDAKQFQAKVQSLEERLYGGSVRNQKELESITSELQYSKEQSTESDEQLLALMLTVDELEKQIAETRARIEELESTQAEARVKLAGERDALKGEPALRRGETRADGRGNTRIAPQPVRKTTEGKTGSGCDYGARRQVYGLPPYLAHQGDAESAHFQCAHYMQQLRPDSIRELIYARRGLHTL